MIFDPRHLSPPSGFDESDEGRYDEWRYQFVACHTARDRRFGNVAAHVARRTSPYLQQDLPSKEEAKKAYIMLYSVIVGCIKNRLLRQVMETECRDRKHDAEYKSTYRGKQMALQRGRTLCASLSGSLAKSSTRPGRAGAATAARTSSVAFRRNWHILRESFLVDRGLRAAEEVMGFWRPS